MDLITFFVAVVLNYNMLLYLVYGIICITLVSFIIEFFFVYYYLKRSQRIYIFIVYLLILVLGYILLFGNSLYKCISVIIIVPLLLYLCCKKCDIKSNFPDIKQLSISSLILISAYLGVQLMLEIFNGKSLEFNIDNISRSMEDWGNFATCLTALFALISIYFAYRAFQSQVNAARRTSFDATFIQIFAQHSSLRQKVVRHHNFKNIDFGTTDLFTIFRLCYININNKYKIDTYKFYNIFIMSIGDCASVDFRNYFKYIYHEISIVINFEFIDEDIKKRYIKLIQSQMNYDELFCYFINQIDYIKRSIEYKDKNNEIIDYKNAIDYAKNLKKYEFFKDLFKENVYRKQINNILSNIDKKFISDDKGQNVLFNENWLY